MGFRESISYIDSFLTATSLLSYEDHGHRQAVGKEELEAEMYALEKPTLKLAGNYPDNNYGPGYGNVVAAAPENYNAVPLK